MSVLKSKRDLSICEFRRIYESLQNDIFSILDKLPNRRKKYIDENVLKSIVYSTKYNIVKLSDEIVNKRQYDSILCISIINDLIMISEMLSHVILISHKINNNFVDTIEIKTNGIITQLLRYCEGETEMNDAFIVNIYHKDKFKDFKVLRDARMLNEMTINAISHRPRNYDNGLNTPMQREISNAVMSIFLANSIMADSEENLKQRISLFEDAKYHLRTYESYLFNFYEVYRPSECTISAFNNIFISCLDKLNGVIHSEKIRLKKLASSDS